MALPEHILLTYSYMLLFAWVLVEQLGIPLPAAPVLLAAGALSAENEISFPLALLAALIGSLIADSSWFLVGRRYGHHMMRILCKLSLEPTSCVRRTQESFGRRRAFTVVIAKFVPGLSLLAAPVAGQNGMSLGSFLFFDVIGVTLWVGALLTAGRFFGDLLRRNPNMLALAGRFSGALLILGILGFLVGRIIRRRMILKKLVAARLEPEELKRQIDAGEPVYIVDLRHPRDLVTDPFTLAGALLFSPDTLTARHHEIPRDRDVVLFCNCPNEAAAAKTAMTLHKLGIERVRPLRGGYDEWKRLGFPLSAVEPANPLPEPAR
jgi:membrane protein DedA with SNARE-associated domain/rhodanese-related sulfurtransferase